MIKHLGLVRFCIPFLALGALQAGTLYTYSGSNFTTETGSALYLANPRWTTSDSISISANFASAFAPNVSDQGFTPLSWSLTVGNTTFSSSDGSSVLLDSIFSTDSLGSIVDWSFSIIGGGTLFPISTSGTVGDRAGVYGPHFGGSASTESIGTWSAAVTAVPEPNTLVFVLAGLVPLARNSHEGSRKKPLILA